MEIVTYALQKPNKAHLKSVSYCKTLNIAKRMFAVSAKAGNINKFDEIHNLI